MLYSNTIQTIMRKKIQWQSTNDPVFPLSASVDGQILKIRINDFPEKELYSLIIDEKSVNDFNEWPEQWKKPGSNHKTHHAQAKL